MIYHICLHFCLRLPWYLNYNFLYIMFSCKQAVEPILDFRNSWKLCFFNQNLMGIIVFLCLFQRCHPSGRKEVLQQQYLLACRQGVVKSYFENSENQPYRKQIVGCNEIIFQKPRVFRVYRTSKIKMYRNYQFVTIFCTNSACTMSSQA